MTCLPPDRRLLDERSRRSFGRRREPCQAGRAKRVRNVGADSTDCPAVARRRAGCCSLRDADGGLTVYGRLPELLEYNKRLWDALLFLCLPLPLDLLVLFGLNNKSDQLCAS